jgi:hypothetical protein
MNERRLLDDDASRLEREVLGAWHDEKAPDTTRARALRLAAETAGLAAVAAGTTKGLAGLGAKGFGWGAPWLVKGAAMALIVGASATIVAAVVSAGPVADVSAPPAPVTRTTPAATDPSSASAAIVVTEVAPPPTSPTIETRAPKSHPAPRGPVAAPPATIPKQSPAQVPAPPASSAPRFTEEVRMLGDAKSALAAKDPERALLALDTFSTLYPSSVLAPEAEVLRIDAHLARGDSIRAKSLAEAFLAAHPSSPYRRHVQSTRPGNE